MTSLSPTHAGEVPVSAAPAVSAGAQYQSVVLVGLLVLGVGLRLIDITQPYVDAWSWRQSGVAMVAENLYRGGFDIFHPRINYAGNVPGYVGTEFPLVPGLAAALYIIFGVQEWVGRLIPVLFFAASVPFFYLLVRKVFTDRAALFAVGVYAVAPLSIYSSRSFMPDTPMLSLSIAGLYLFSEWLDRPDRRMLTIALRVVTCLAILVKIPAVIVGVPMLYMAWRKHGPGLFRRADMWSFAAWTLIPVAIWYSHAWFQSVAHYPYHFLGEGGFTFEPEMYRRVLGRLTTSHLTPVVFAGMLIGALLPVRHRYGRLFHWWFFILVVFVLVASRGNRHAWYQLPYVAVAAAFTGYAWDVALRRLERTHTTTLLPILASVLFFGAIGALSFHYVRPHYYSWANSMRNAGMEIDRIADKDALIVAQDRGDPTLIYYSKRKGWHIPISPTSGLFVGNPETSDEIITQLEERRAEGADYLVFPSHTRWWLDYYKEFQQHVDSLYRRVRENEEYVIIDLRGDTTASRPSARGPAGGVGGALP